MREVPQHEVLSMGKMAVGRWADQQDMSHEEKEKLLDSASVVLRLALENRVVVTVDEFDRAQRLERAIKESAAS